MTATHTQIRTFDIVVYGATPAGIATAVRAAREGLRVLLVNHARHLGGFLTSGAGGWETPCDYMRSPIFTEVRQAITKHYRETYGEGSQQHLASMPQADSRRHFVFSQIEHAYMVRYKDWKLVVHTGDRSELYHVTQDPHEHQNLFGRPEWSDVERELLLYMMQVLGSHRWGGFHRGRNGFSG